MKCRYKTESGFCKVNYRKNETGMEIRNRCRGDECNGINEGVNKFLVCPYCDSRYPIQKAHLGCICDSKKDENGDPFSFTNLYDIKYL